MFSKYVCVCVGGGTQVPLFLPMHLISRLALRYPQLNSVITRNAFFSHPLVSCINIGSIIIIIYKVAVW